MTANESVQECNSYRPPAQELPLARNHHNQTGKLSTNPPENPLGSPWPADAGL